MWPEEKPRTRPPGGGCGCVCICVCVCMLLIVPTSSLWSLTVVHQTLHERHRPPPGKRHAESPTRLVAARKALTAAPFAGRIVWTREDAVAALKLVHTVEHRTTARASRP